MYPGFIPWWNRARKAREAWACGPEACHPGGGGRHRVEGYQTSADDEGIGATFGVRRPLRFMAHKLELNDDQVKELAIVLNDLKTERAQAAVDNQRTVAAFAEALGGDAFDKTRADEGLALRVESAERLRQAVAKALERTHAILDPEQRKKLAYLLRSGALTI
jgi:Spy/CpxP family protein refolding chaperone